jgi:hypothetical protein
MSAKIKDKTAIYLRKFLECPKNEKTYAYRLYNSMEVSRAETGNEIGQGHLGSVYFKTICPADTSNVVGFVHGGALSTYVDIATTMALYGFDSKSRV